MYWALFSNELLAYSPPKSVSGYQCSMEMALGQIQSVELRQQQILFDGMNVPFFENRVSRQHFMDRAHACELDTNVDVRLVIRKYFEQRPDLDRNHPLELIEVGAAYGRVVDAARAHLNIKRLRAYEQTPKFIDFLKERYAASPEIEVIGESILKSRKRSKADLIFMMWFTFGEFSPQDQFRLLKKLRRLTREGGGMLAIDLPQDSRSSGGATVYTGQMEKRGRLIEYKMSIDDDIWYRAWLPDIRHFVEQSRRAGFTEIEDQVYGGGRGPTRRMFYLR